MPKNSPNLSAIEVNLLFEGFSADHWYEATRCARLLCLGLPEVTANELLHEAIVLVLNGTRHFQRNVEPSIGLYFVMRSIASHVRKRMKDGPIDYGVEVISDFGDENDIPNKVVPTSLASPEKIAQDRELIVHIDRLLDDDYDVKRLLHLWSEGTLGSDARLELGMSLSKFEAVNKRLRRTLAAYKLRSL